MSTSLWQTPQACTLMSTCPAAGFRNLALSDLEICSRTGICATFMVELVAYWVTSGLVASSMVWAAAHVLHVQASADGFGEQEEKQWQLSPPVPITAAIGAVPTP